MTTLAKLPERVEALESRILQLRTELLGEFSAVRDAFVTVGQNIREGDEETRRYMRVLHEDVIGRIALLREGRDPGKPKKKPSP